MGSNRSRSPSSRHDHSNSPGDMGASYVGGVSLIPTRLGDSLPSYIVVRALGGACVAGKTPQRNCGSGFIRGTARSVINGSIAVIMRKWWADIWYINSLDFVSAIGIAVLFTAGGLFGDLIESWRIP